MDKVTIAIAPERGMAEVDELAEALGVLAWGGGSAFVLEGRSGKTYNVAELLLAHIKLMQATT